MGWLTAFSLNPRATMSEAGLRTRFAALRNQLDSAESLRQQAEVALAELRESAARAGLASALRELENPAPRVPREREASDTRVRFLESLSAEHEGIPVYGAVGDVADVPRSIAWRFASAGLVEFVDPATTPLFRVPTRW